MAMTRLQILVCWWWLEYHLNNLASRLVTSYRNERNREQ